MGRRREEDEGEGARAALLRDTRRLPAAHTRVVVRLRRGDEADALPWITELVCVLFSAQGDVLCVHRNKACDRKASEGEGGRGDVEPITMRRFASKEAIEKERMTIRLQALHPSAEVLGVLVTYNTDEIARRPKLNAFFVSCDACPADDDDDDDALRTFTAASVMPDRVYADPECRSEWMLHGIGAAGSIRSSIDAALVEATQVFLLDIIPEIEFANRNALNTVASVCAALSRDEILQIEPYFREEGVKREEFAKLLLLALLKSRHELQRLSRATALVVLLFEMFEQIDINGDGVVDWEEFTSFCVNLGLIATKAQHFVASNAYSCSYQQQICTPSNSRNFAYQIRQIKAFRHLRIIAVIENKSPVVLMYDPDMVFIHEFTHVARMCRENDRDLAILDVEYVPPRNLLVVSASDQSMTFWSVVNVSTCAYVFAYKIGCRYPITHLHWGGEALSRLITISSDGMQFWDVESKRVVGKLAHHRDRVTSCIEVSLDSPLLITSSFDTTIAALSIPSFTVVFELRGHLQGVLHLDYTTHGSLLLSSGFEHQAYCWNLSTQSLLVTLGGHMAGLIGARFVSAGNAVALAVTGDERGHFRLWDVSPCLKGHPANLATPLQYFEVASANICRFHTFVCGFTPSGKQRSDDTKRQMTDVITGCFRLHRFCAVVHATVSAPPRHVVFNTLSSSLVGSVDGVITVWSANSGLKLEEPIIIRDADVCAIAFDVPRQRKLFIATSDGSIRLYNPITAMLLTMQNTSIHDGRISALILCPRTSCILSTGFDRRICISCSTAGKTDIEVLRTVDNAHDSCITVAAYSEAEELIATGDDAGNIHIYDFQRLYLLLRCVGHTGEVRGLQFHRATSLLFSADKSCVFVWHVAVSGTVYETQPFMQLTLSVSSVFATEVPLAMTRPHSRPSTGVTAGHFLKSSSITCLLTTPETKHSPPYVYAGTTNGTIWAWNLRAITNDARKSGIGEYFEFRFPNSAGDFEENSPNAMLRVSHKTSVLKLRGEDAAAPSNGALARKFGRSRAAEKIVVEHTCDASFVWQGHSEPIEQLYALPYPGQLFSVSADSSLRIWDASYQRIGTITTIAEPKSTQSVTPPSTWKFTFHHHLANEAKERHAAIAGDMLRRAKRWMQRAEKRSCTHEYQSRPDSGEPDVTTPREETCNLPPTLAAAEIRLANQGPFSHSSLRSGVHEGLFGAEENRLLQELAVSPIGKQHPKPLLAPLALSTSPHYRHSNLKAHRPEGREHELPMMRTMKNFPREIERRKAAEKRMERRLDADLSLSPFLKEKLYSPPRIPSRKQPTSTSLQIKMDTCVTVIEETTLPLLRTPGRVAGDHEGNARVASHPNRARLSAVASAPCLPIYTPAQSPDFAKTALVPRVPAPSSPSRTNIERKMRLYEGSEAATSDDTQEAHQRFKTQRQMSQPQMGTMTKTKSSSTRRLAPPAGESANPFGPHYTVRQVTEFGGILARFDNDCSGDIDKAEWVRMLQSCRPFFGSNDLDAAERLFYSIDRDDSGKISLQEILPMMFSKATSEQLGKMQQHLQKHVDAAPSAVAANKPGTLSYMAR